MKRLVVLCTALILICSWSIVKAQSASNTGNRALSAQYKSEMDILKSEINTLKLKLKNDKDNVDLKAELRKKTENYNSVKDKKAVIDRAIKSLSASEKATEKAEKAQREAEKAAKAAQQIKEKEPVR